MENDIANVAEQEFQRRRRVNTRIGAIIGAGVFYIASLCCIASAKMENGRYNVYYAINNPKAIAVEVPIAVLGAGLGMAVGYAISGRNQGE